MRQTSKESYGATKICSQQWWQFEIGSANIYFSVEENVRFLPIFVKIEKFNLDDAGLNGNIFQKYFSTESFLSIHNFLGPHVFPCRPLP